MDGAIYEHKSKICVVLVLCQVFATFIYYSYLFLLPTQGLSPRAVNGLGPSFYAELKACPRALFRVMKQIVKKLPD